MANRILTRLSLIAALLAFFVVMLGAFTRLTDAGLGCPDWPGCYGHFWVPKQAAAASYSPTTPLVAEKAWTEMVHRYFAGSLALLIVILAFGGWRAKKTTIPRLLPWALLVLIIMQALLGMYTVTLKLWPIVVMAHLLGGMTTLALLWWFALTAGEFLLIPDNSRVRFLVPWARIGLIVIALQIALGGWTSANYAGLVCPDFPRCEGQFLPEMDWRAAFNLLHSQKTYLSIPAERAVQMTHRLGAFITLIYLGSLGVALWRTRLRVLRNLAYLLWALLALQIHLGISNVLHLLPLPIAVGHNAVAALLLLTVVSINVALHPRRSAL